MITVPQQATQEPRVHPASSGIARIPHLSAFLGGEGEVVAGWGRKPSGARAQALAAKKGLAWLLLEDGFVRSVERNDPPLSLVIDDRGIYYDAGHASRLERLIAEPLRPEQKARARTLTAAWRQARVSKYNHAREYEGELPEPYVLVCDQTFGDASVACGLANEESFARMLEAALTENPDCEVVVKTHPDIFTRRKRGYFAPDTAERSRRIRMISEDCHPVRLIEEAQKVYTVTSQMGFEALIHGKPVRTFGMPFYAGWGLTEDDCPAPPRRGRASMDALVYAALVAYSRYVDPETGRACGIESVLGHIDLQRRMRARFGPEIHAVGFSPWKQPILRRFLAGSNLQFAGKSARLPRRATIAVWGNDGCRDLPQDARLLRIEDGFLRSVGLGADLAQPLSWACDDLGIYYDAGRPSRLERILTEASFDRALLARARALRGRILSAGVTKYNVAAPPWRRPAAANRVILVPGQVEQDASIRCGCRHITTNFELLRAVRDAHPHAHLVYKPHPDVMAGLRPSGRGEREAASLCNEIIGAADMARLLDEVDEVHTMTSLAGFEALMRGRAVTCYGQPFYAGWGLTTDIAPIARRSRNLSLDELVAGCLILYPVYVSRVTGRFTTPERAVEELILWRETGGGGLPLWRKALRPAFRLWKNRRNRKIAQPRPYADSDMEAAHGRR